MSTIKKISSLLDSSSKYTYSLLEQNFSLLFAPKSVKTIIVCSSLLAAGITLSLKHLRIFENFELLVYDHLVQTKPDAELDDRFLVVTITEEDLERYGWPISDEILATLLANLQAHQPRVIGLDLYRNIPHPPGYGELESALQADNLIAVQSVGMNLDKGDIPPPPMVSAERIGFNDFVIDEDGVVRRNLMYVDSADPYSSFALKLSTLYLSNSSVDIQAEEDYLTVQNQPFPVLHPTSGGYQNVDARGYQTLLTYYSRTSISPTVTLQDALTNHVDPDQINDKIILIGTTARSVRDNFYTPYSASQQDIFRMPGVLIHAQMVRQIIDTIQGHEITYRFLPAWGEGMVLVVWCGVAGLVSWYSKTPLKLILGTIIGLGVIAASGIIAFDSMIWMPIVEPSTGFIMSIGIVLAARIHYSALRDPLTRLLNRDGFLEQLQWQLDYVNHNQAAKSLAVIFFDLDHFKFVNESLGHQVGDQILKTIVARVETCLSTSAGLARVGGDEFAILVPYCEQTELAHLVQTIKEKAEVPVEIANQSIVIKISIGIAMTTTYFYYKADELLRDAHTAMYRAKSLGRDRYEIFATGMHKEATQRLELESDLRKAIEEATFFLTYQPILCLETGKLSGFEALVRWKHHQRGIISPHSFIPIAEESGLIIPLGLWIFKEACRQLERWHQEFSDQPHLTMSINLSGRQIGQSDLITQLKNILDEVPISAHYIRVEITETMLMTDVQSAIDLMLQIKELGLKLAIDDFGTGYSSLSYLHRFPIDYLKVDKSFIGQMEKSQEDYEIVRTIITLGHTLGMDVVAEGLETRHQQEILNKLECEYGQGYLFSKPLPADDMTRLLRQSHDFAA